MTEIVVRNLKAVLANITELATKNNRTVRLVAVSKTFPADFVFACYEQGQRHFGENYVDELEEKARCLAAKGATEIRWHFIGRIQTNKIKRIAAIPGLWCVETVDSGKHASTLQSAVSALGRNLNVFLQVNTSGEQNKGGVKPTEVAELCKHVQQNCPNLSLLGLMTIGSLSESSNLAENADFELLRSLRDQLVEQLGQVLELSMGMSSDYALAVECGSTSVRVGSSIFGHRIYADEKLTGK